VDAQMRVFGFDKGSVEDSRNGPLPPQTLDLPVKPAAPLLEVGLEGLALITVAAAVAESGLGVAQESLLALAARNGVDPEGPRHLG